MKDTLDEKTIDFIKTDKTEMERRIRQEQEQFFTQTIWELQNANLSKTDLKIFWWILIEVQKQQAKETSEDESMKPFINFDIDIPAIAKTAEIAVPNIHRTLRKLEKTFLTKDQNKKYSLKFNS